MCRRASSTHRRNSVGGIDELEAEDAMDEVELWDEVRSMQASMLVDERSCESSRARDQARWRKARVAALGADGEE